MYFNDCRLRKCGQTKNQIIAAIPVNVLNVPEAGT